MLRFLLLLAAHLLVLAALLALGFWYARADIRQVQQFADVEEAFRWENAQQLATNRELLIESELKASETNIHSDSLRFQLGKSVAALTEHVRLALHGVREGLIARSGGQTDAGIPHNPRSEVAVARFLADSSSELRLLSARVDSFIVYLQPFVPAASRAYLTHNLAFPPDRWSRLQEYGGMPLAGLLAELARREQFALENEKAALDAIFGRKDGCGFDETTARVANNWKQVKPGQVYEAELFLVYSNPSFIDPCNLLDSIVFEGKKLRPRGGRARLEIVAQLPPTGVDVWGNARQRWQAEGFINLADTTISFSQECIVSAPRLNVTINSEQPVLYRHCANPLRVHHQMPPPAGTAPQRFLQVEGGRLMGAGALSAPWVLAEAPVVKVHILDVADGSRVQTETFRTVEPPPPGLRLWQGDSAVSLRRGVAASSATISIRAEAEEGFEATCPAEAHYRAQGRVALYHQGKPQGAPLPFRNSQPVDLQPLVQLAQPGDWYVVEVQRCERINSVGAVCPVSNRRYEPVIVPLY